MSGTVMKFGPQWLRALTDGGTSGIGSNTGNEATSQSSSATSSTTSNNGTSHQPSSPQQQVMQSNMTNNNHQYQTSSSMPLSLSTLAGSVSQQQQKRQPPQITKYKLAEFRYGREEMLALFDQGMPPPEELKKFTDLYVESARIPMTMVQMSDEELRLSTRNWNSDAVLRATGKTAVSTNTAATDRERGSITEPRANAIPQGGNISSTSRGPPGSLSTRSSMPPDSRGGLLGSQMRGPPGRLVRVPGPYARSQSHEDDGLDDGLNNYINHDSRGAGNHLRDPLKSRYEQGRSSGLSGVSKPAGLDSSKCADNDAGGERRSVFDRPLPVRNGLDDKLGGISRKDSGGPRPAQSNDWRSRDNWAGTDRTAKVSSSTEERPWRTSRAPDDWRSPNPSSSSWYSRSDDRNNSRNAAQDTDNLSSSYNSNKRDTLRRPSGSEKHGDHHYDDDDIHHRHRRDSLPEWSVDDPSGDKVGSFDASGAFRESTAEDDAEGLSMKQRQDSNQDGTNNKNFDSLNSTNNSGIQNDNSGRRNNDWRSTDSNGDESISLNGSKYISENNIDIATLMSLTSGSTKNNSSKNLDANSDSADIKQSPNSTRKNIHERFPSGAMEQTSNTNTQSNHEGSLMANSSLSGDNPKKRLIDAEIHNQASSSQTCQQLIDQAMSRHDQQAELQLLLRSQFDQQLRMTAFNNQMNITQAPNEEDGFAHLERAAEIMVAEWTAEEEHVEPNIASSVKFVDNQDMNRNQRGAQFNPIHLEARLAGQQPQQSGENHMNATTPPADSNDHNRFIVLPFNHENSQNWFYRDTQGVIQGPFNATEMFEWLKAGYFVKELLIRRACDECFCQLGDVMKLWDRIPFLPPNVPPPPPITATAIYQQRELNKQLALAAGLAQQPSSGGSFSLSHPGSVLIHAPIIQSQIQTSVHQSMSNDSASNISGAQGISSQVMPTQDQSVSRKAQDDMQMQLRLLLAQLKDREGFSNLNAQQQQEVLVQQFVANKQQQQQHEEELRLHKQLIKQQALLEANRMEEMRKQEEIYRRQELRRMELQQEEVEKERFLLQHRIRAEEEKQRMMDEHQRRQQKQQEQENEKNRREFEVEKERQRLKQMKQQQLQKQQEEFRQQMQQQQQNQAQAQQQRQEQQEKQPSPQLSVIQQQQQQHQQLLLERSKKAQQQQQQAEQKRPAWSTSKRADPEPISLATLQKLQEETEKEKERQRKQLQQLQQLEQQQQNIMQSNQQQLQQLRQMTWANAAQQKPAPIKTLAEIQKEEEERLAQQKQKENKVQASVPNAGVWNNAASHLSWKNPPNSSQTSSKSSLTQGIANTANPTSPSSASALVGSTLAGGNRASRRNRSGNAVQVPF